MKKLKSPIHILTQEELLEEAKITEQYNIESLQILQKLEEEKKKFHLFKPIITGPRIIYHSKQGKDLITFSNGNIPINLNPISELSKKKINKIFKYFKKKIVKKDQFVVLVMNLQNMLILIQVHYKKIYLNF